MTTAEPDVLAWTTSLAARAVPDEVDSAPDLAAAYLRGGTDRRGLFSAPRSDPGAFGGGLALQLPYILDCVTTCFAVVKGFVGDSAVNTTVATASLVVAVRQMRVARRTPEDRSPAAETTATVPAVAPSAQPGSAPADAPACPRPPRLRPEAPRPTRTSSSEPGPRWTRWWAGSANTRRPPITPRTSPRRY